MKLRIGLDIDDTILHWFPEYLKRFGEPKNEFEITRHVQRDLRKDREFWLNLQPKHRPNFPVTLYCTKRVCNKDWSKRWIEDHDYPIAPVYQIVTQSKNKAHTVKGKVDVFIDDSISNFKAMNLAGVPCLLMDCEHNRSWGPIGRVYSLDEDEIKDAYDLFMLTIFPNFQNLL